MSACISLVLLFCLVANMFISASGGKRDDLRYYYSDATVHLLDACQTVLRNLTQLVVKLEHKGPLYAAYARFKKLAIDHNDGVKSGEICQHFNLYKNAFVLLNEVIGLKQPFSHVLANWRTTDMFDPVDSVYKTWISTCPQYQSNEKISLFYTPDEQYLSHDRNPLVVCCERERSVGDWERNFFLRPYSGAKVVQYGDVVGVGYKEGRFLSNEGSRMNWYKTKMDSWERWRVETYCTEDYESYGVGRAVHFCDLVMFHAVDDGNYFRLLTRTKDRGPYNLAILGSQGTIPFWRIT